MFAEWEVVLSMMLITIGGLLAMLKASRVAKQNSFEELLEAFTEQFGGYLDRTNLAVSGFHTRGYRGIFYIDLTDTTNVRWMYQLETSELYGVTMEFTDHMVRWESPKYEDMPLDAFALWLFEGDKAEAQASGLENTPQRTIDELSIQAGKLTFALLTPTSSPRESAPAPGELIESTYRRALETLVRLVKHVSTPRHKLEGKQPAALLDR